MMKMTKVKTAFAVLLVAALALALSAVREAASAVCARVKIEIIQELTFERVAFDARLVITNNLPDEPLSDLSVKLDITDEFGEDASGQFFVKVLSMDKVNAVDGTGTIPPQVASEIHWILMPVAGAGGTSQAGKQYFVGGNVQFTAQGVPQDMSLIPDMITVKPQPELVIDYFLPREVWADDPFTAPVESPMPFTLGVRVRNAGHGPATTLSINSGQPKIVENKQGLLIDFRLLGSAVNDKPVAPTLNLVMGNILPQACSTGRWQMITTLSGKFIDFNASYTHASELGGEMTSLLKSVDARFLTREVLVDLPGSDAVRDYLSYTDPLGDRMPETIYSSDCNDLPVNVAEGTASGSPLPGAPSVTLLTTVMTGWTYTKVFDPAGGRLLITEALRSDGKRINANNVWVSEEKPTGKQADPSAFYLNLLDHDTTGNYKITYSVPPTDTTPPVTTVHVGEPSYGQAPTYVTSLTNFILMAVDDISGSSSMFYNLDSTLDKPAFPFSIKGLIIDISKREGPHTIAYYSRDGSGNTEATRSMDIFVDDSAPVIAAFGATPAVITPSAPDTYPHRQAALAATATDAISPVKAKFEIASGAAASNAEFDALPLVRTLTADLASGQQKTVAWDGRNGAGNIVPAGAYTARLTATDQLGHASSAFASISVAEFIAAGPLSAAPADQMYPSVSGSRVVWQDFRNGKWDIYMRDLSDSSTSNLTAGKLADQARPWISGDRVVWQDRSHGNWDIVLYDIQAGTETRISTSLADETMPFVQGGHVAYQSGPSGGQDIYLYDAATGQTLRLTNDVRDQINPVIDNGRVVWEDYRHGLAEIYEYDIASKTEKRLTDNVGNQTSPTAAGGLVWVDGRDGNRELYMRHGNRERRLTRTLTDEAQPYMAGTGAIFVDYASGLSDPNLSYMNLLTRRSARIISDLARQEEPRLEGSLLVWQDNRLGQWQIFSGAFTPPQDYADFAFETGLNLVAVTKGMKDAHGGAYALLAAWKDSVAPAAIYSHDRASGAVLMAGLDNDGAPFGDDFALEENRALFVYAGSEAAVTLSEVSSCAPLALSAGFNMASVACVPESYTSFEMIRSLGPEAISISRFDNASARWVTTAVDGADVVGEEFTITQGEGYLIYTTGEVLNWIP